MSQGAGRAVAEGVFAATLGPCWAAILVGLWMVRPREYQLDLYAEVGPLVWAGVAVGMVASVVAIVASRRLAGLAYANLAALSLAVVAVPTAIGYFSYGRADSLTIIGSIGGTVRTGHVLPQNLYPGTDFIGASLALATGLRPDQVFAALGLVTSAALLALLCLFVHFATDAPRHQAVYLAAFVLYFGWVHVTGIPNFIFLGTAATLLYVAVALPQRLGARLVLILLLAVPIVMGHPFVAGYLLLALIALAITNPSGRKLDLLAAVGLVAVALVVWANVNPGLSMAIERHLAKFETTDVAPASGEAVEKAERIGHTVAEWARFVALYLGRFILPAAAVGFGWAMTRPREWWRSQRGWAWGLLGAGLVAQAVLLFNPLVAHTIIRVINVNYVVFGLVPLFGVAIALMARRAWGRAGVAMIASATMVVTVFGVFDSPATFQANQEYGKEEVAAGRWLLSERGPHPAYNPLGGFQKRAIALHFDQPRSEDRLAPRGEGKVPDHFVGGDATRPVYIVVPTVDRILYRDLWPEVGRFTDEDFGRLLHNPDLAVMYDSMGIETFYRTPPVARAP